MADLRSKHVRQKLADIHSRAHFILDMVDRAPDREVAAGDILGIGSIGALTVSSSGATVNSVQAVSNSELALTVNRDPSIHFGIPMVDKIQDLEGSWSDQVAQTALINMRNFLDSDFLEYCASGTSGDVSPAWDTAGTYHVNRTSTNSITRDDILTARSILLGQDGGFPQNLMLVVDAYAEAAIMNIAEFIPSFSKAEEGILGIPQLGSVFGIPVFSTNSVEQRHDYPCTGVTIATNIATVTMAAGHGFVPGELITIAGITTPLTTAAAITSVTSTTLVVPLTAADGAMADGVGTVTGQNTRCLMLDRSFVGAAFQKMPSFRVKPQTGTTTDEGEVSCLWGRRGRSGRVVVIHTPYRAL